MFDWLGFKAGLPLWVSWQLNKELREDVEQSFEGIAETRKELLINWAADNWMLAERLGQQIQGKLAQSPLDKQAIEPLLHKAYARAIDVTEFFFLDVSRQVVATTYPPHRGAQYAEGSILAGGLAYAAAGSEYRKCLYGPIRDPLTLRIGARSSSFHDAVTLLFIYPVVVHKELAGFLVGRVPNDVLGDLIQRESGHIYPDSGDNYIFMAEAGLNRGVQPGTALSRSRFEDHTFTHGENLKDGVKTKWGTVSVKEHTELELLFTDPANGQLHPGVANTMRKGSNLEVRFPGYSDYRHIPVIGKGVTFQLPHCPDKWGMMCEGDLQEVYSIRSITWRHAKLQAAAALCIGVLLFAATAWLAPLVSGWLLALLLGLAAMGGGLAFFGLLGRKENRRAVNHLRSITRFIRMNAEGKGDLTQRLPLQQFDDDELKDVAKWINNMIDSLEGIMLQVKLAATDVSTSQQLLNESASATTASSARVGDEITAMIASIRRQLNDIDLAKDKAADMRAILLEVEAQAAGQIALATSEVSRIGEMMGHISHKVQESNAAIHTFMDTAQQIAAVVQAIEQISAQTNLLALNATIEAARVGEQGKGFAVVAGEIRKLANRAQASTEEAASITQSISHKARHAFSLMQEGSAAVAEGNKLVHAATGTLAEAQARDARKSQAVDEVVQLLDLIAEVSQENRAVSAGVEDEVVQLQSEMGTVQQTSQSVEDMTALMQQLVGQFTLTKARIR